jgi:metal-dependent amidase/aminoacylase/carboxypeptidase family protein
MVNALCNIQARFISCHEKVTMAVCNIHAGSASNVMPETAFFSGTIRDYDPALFERVVTKLRKICAGIADSTDCSVDVKIGVAYPALVNHPVNAGYVRDAAKRVLGDSCVIARDP